MLVRDLLQVDGRVAVQVGSKSEASTSGGELNGIYSRSSERVAALHGQVLQQPEFVRCSSLSVASGLVQAAVHCSPLSRSRLARAGRAWWWWRT